MRRLIFFILSISLLLVSACSQSAVAPTPTVPPTSKPAALTPSQASTPPNLGAIKTYTAGKATALKKASDDLAAASDKYYTLAQGAKLDYAALWKSQKEDTIKAIQQARAAWIVASPLYEQMEGIVAGVGSLAAYDVIIDAGTSAEEGGENVVPFDLKLPDGRILPKPGNLFGVTESTLWGTFADYSVKDIQADFNGNGKIDFGEAIPDANVLKGGADALAKYSGDLLKAVGDWTPTESDAFTALVVMVPTMTEYFDSWKASRFVSGDASTQRDFVVISRLSDIVDIVSGLEVVYQGVSPLVKGADVAQDAQISQGLADLRKFVADIYAREQGGQHFKAEDADLLGTETEDRATAITGQITQMAARLNIQIEA